MAFDNVTFFEVNLPEEVFTSGSRGESKYEQPDDGPKSGKSDDSESGGRSKGKMFLVLVALAGIAFGVRKLRSDGDDEEIEMAYEQPGVEVEQTEP